MYIIVKAIWDDDAKVWVASSYDLPGLNTEADTAELLVEKLSLMIPDLLDANHLDAEPSEVEFCIQSERRAIVHIQAVS
ncbi:DUF1902 domain-containing protein [Gammaproteobacteria bacterium]